MGIDNPTSRAWEHLIAITDGPEYELEKMGIAPFGAPSPNERRLLGERGHVLAIRVDEDKIIASISNEVLSGCKFPAPRVFSVKGDAHKPTLLEIHGEERTAANVFGELVFWLRSVASRSAR
jgi:hypothetical protein